MAATISTMVAKYTATVIDGKLVLDEPTTGLPDGAKVDLLLDWSEDRLTEAERKALWRTIQASRESAARGEGITREEMPPRLMAKRGR